jgi:hypothetical protein
VRASVVLELAERRQDGERLSLYADRDRIRRDLHDLAIQRLFAASMSLQGAYKITGQPEVARRVTQAVADLDETIKVIRSTIFSPHAHETDQVDTLVGEQASEHLLAVLREALSNTARHAHATSVKVDVPADVAGIEFAVTDDGKGTNPRERAEQPAGAFATTPATICGTVLERAVPIPIGDGSGRVIGHTDAVTCGGGSISGAPVVGVDRVARRREAMISASAAARPTHAAPSTDLPGSKSL